MTDDKPLVLDFAIHHAMREMAQAIADEHGVAILDVRIEWHTEQPLGSKPIFRVSEIEVRTRSV